MPGIIAPRPGKNSEIDTAVECLKLGAKDYLVKPIDLKMFSSALRHALEIGLLRNEVISLKGIFFGAREYSNRLRQGTYRRGYS